MVPLGVPMAGPANRSGSLKIWLVLLVAVVALPFCLLSAAVVLRSQEAVRSQAEGHLRAQARLLALVLDGEFDRLEAGLSTLGGSAAMRLGDRAATEREMRTLSVALGGAAVALADAGGNPLGGVGPGSDEAGAAAPAADFAPLVRAVLRSGRAATGALPRPGHGDAGDALAGIAVPIRPGRGRPGAPAVPDLVLAAALPPHRLAAAVDEAAGGAGLPGLAAAVLDRDGIVVAASRAPPGGGAIGPETRDALRGRLALETNGVLHQDGRDGPAAVLAFARAPRSGYAAVLSAPAAAQAPAGAALGPLAGASVLVLLGGSAIAVLLARRVRQEMGLLAAVGPEGPSAPAAASASLSGLREVQELAEALSAAAAERDLATARLARSERRFRALAEAGALVVWRGDAEGRIREAQGWQELTGQACGATQDGGWRAMLHPEDLAGLAAAWAAARPAGRPLDVECRLWTASLPPGRLPAGLAARPPSTDAPPRDAGSPPERTAAAAAVSAAAGGAGWRRVRVRGVPVSGPEGTEWVGVLEDVDDRRRAEQALAEREQRLRLAVEAARLTTWEYDAAAGLGTRTGRDDDAFTAPPPSGFRLADWMAHLHPEDRAATAARFEAVVAGAAAQFAAEFRVRRRPPAEGWVWMASYGAAVERDPATGRALRITGVAQDIAERREAEQRRGLLAREVDHRAKNALAVVQSVLRLARRDRPEEFAASVEQRVAALARVHTLLADRGWAGAELRAVAERELGSFLPGGAVRLEGPPVALAATAVQPIAMVLHELATNAAKHGALSAPAGRVVLSWWLDGEGRLRLLWQEEGGPPVAAELPARRGFGSRVIEATIRGQLGGTLTLGWDPAGLSCAIALPTARVLAGRAVAGGGGAAPAAAAAISRATEAMAS